VKRDFKDMTDDQADQFEHLNITTAPQLTDPEKPLLSIPEHERTTKQTLEAQQVINKHNEQIFRAVAQGYEDIMGEGTHTSKRKKLPDRWQY
jgi:hypothetical protein